MPKVKLKVSILSYTQNPLKVIYSAAKQCYSKLGAQDHHIKEMKKAKQEEFLTKLISSGHMSPLEHVSFTFAIEGISRACTHQLVRHRLASFSQQSQRYVGKEEFDFIIPPSIEKDKTLKKIYIEYMNDVASIYRKILDNLSGSFGFKEKAREDARFVLPNACESKIAVTMNCRQLLHFFGQRCCERAQWEIRNLADEMLRLVKEVLPVVFSGVGAKCETLGYCPEGKFCCGKYPTKEKFFRKKA